MKSTRVFKILSAALAAVVMFYFLVQGVRYLTNPYATTRVYTSTTELTVEASGWLVREEETFRTDAETLSPTREEGEKVGKGQVIAATYNSPGALEAVAQIQAKRLQLEQLEYALSSYLNPDAALKLDGSISDDIMALRKNLTGGDYTAASGDLSQLKAAIVKRSRAYTSSQEIKAEITAVQDEIDSLQAGLTGASNITAPRAGTYSAVCDGYESVLTPAGLGDLTPGALDKLAAGENNANVGKLIYGNTWYYAAAVTQEEAQRIAGCGSVSLRLTKGITDDIAATVHSVSPAEDGRCVVVLACREYLAETTQLRHQTAQIGLHSHTDDSEVYFLLAGLRLLSICLRQAEDGTVGVYCAQGGLPQFKPVNMVYQGDDYVLVSVPTGTGDRSILRPGDEVLMTGVTLDGTQILTGDYHRKGRLSLGLLRKILPPSGSRWTGRPGRPAAPAPTSSWWAPAK